MKYRVRFHLQRGEHYMHWQVRGWDGSVQYFDPNEYQIEMLGCNLVNKIGAAKRVNNEGVKDVCGWVECDNYHVYPSNNVSIEGMESLSYNPIKDIHWRRSGDDGDFDWDNYYFDWLLTNGNKVYIAAEAISLI